MINREKIFKSYKRKHSDNNPVCELCGKEIASSEHMEYTETRRKTELFYHTDCVRKIGVPVDIC